MHTLQNERLSAVGFPLCPSAPSAVKDSFILRALRYFVVKNPGLLLLDPVGNKLRRNDTAGPAAGE